MSSEAFVVTLVAPSGYKQVFRVQGASRYVLVCEGGDSLYKFYNDEHEELRTIVVGQGFSHMLTYYDEGGNIAPIP